jgi:hypothetical protein
MSQGNSPNSISQNNGNGRNHYTNRFLKQNVSVFVPDPNLSKRENRKLKLEFFNEPSHEILNCSLCRVPHHRTEFLVDEKGKLRLTCKRQSEARKRKKYGDLDGDMDQEVDDEQDVEDEMMEEEYEESEKSFRDSSSAGNPRRTSDSGLPINSNLNSSRNRSITPIVLTNPSVNDSFQKQPPSLNIMKNIPNESRKLPPSARKLPSAVKPSPNHNKIILTSNSNEWLSSQRGEEDWNHRQSFDEGIFKNSKPLTSLKRPRDDFEEDSQGFISHHPSSSKLKTNNSNATSSRFRTSSNGSSNFESQELKLNLPTLNLPPHANSSNGKSRTRETDLNLIQQVTSIPNIPIEHLNRSFQESSIQKSLPISQDRQSTSVEFLQNQINSLTSSFQSYISKTDRKLKDQDMLIAELRDAMEGYRHRQVRTFS